jgi:uncharacterized protein YbaA (DUF1428 family)
VCRARAAGPASREVACGIYLVESGTYVRIDKTSQGVLGPATVALWGRLPRSGRASYHSSLANAVGTRAARSSLSRGAGGGPKEVHMALYVDGFIVPVQKKKVEEYRQLAKKAGKIWREYGAVDYRECIADDVKPGKRTSFPQSVKLKKNEVVVFSWISYKSRKQRDRVNAKVMKDPRIAAMMKGKTPPFDPKRMIYGGFTTLVA